MNRPFRVLRLVVLTIFVFAASVSAGEVDFSRDVLPILSDRCFHCHGPDPEHREADLRLDLAENALEDRGGYAAVVPGNSDASEMMARIQSTDPGLRMPPPSSNRKRLSPAEIETLCRWIDAGAAWGKHWAFEPPKRPAIPDPNAHPIDAFIRQRLQNAGMKPSPPAEKHTQLRRLSFDLTGLPPTVEELAAFESDSSPGAYDRAVDRLLASPHFGERMAMWWLDAARYSDTDGFQQDATRTNWPWRDWVVESFNENKPFDQFTIEQFAGDLLPNATPEQILATCFHRNHMTNGEGGRDPEESRIDYVIDRVNTMGTVWLGLTLGCCQCHTHKFDPITQAEYYSLFAFFNSIDEDGRAGNAAKPYLKYQSPHSPRAVVEAQKVVDEREPLVAEARKQAEAQFAGWLTEQIQRVADGFEPWRVLQASSLESVEGTILAQESDGVIQAGGPNPKQDDYRVVASVDLERVTALRLEVFPHPSHTDGKLSRGATGEFILTDVKLQRRRRGASQLQDVLIADAVADAEKEAQARDYGKIRDTLDDDPRNGWTTESHDPTQKHVAVFALAEPLYLSADEELIFVMLHRSTQGDANIGRFRLSITDQPGAAVRSLEPMPLEQLAQSKPVNADAVAPELKQRLFDQFLADHQEYQRAKKFLDDAKRQLAQVRQAAKELDVMVLVERKEPRETFVLERGVWDKPGENVSPGFPAAVLAWPQGESWTRLDLARWLVARDNPLTARVVVNHLWQLCFGAGLVRTPDDFGLQGERPTHPELLDWLAVELMEQQWDLKHLLRLIVTSDAYRQSSETTPEALSADPENRLLARQSRHRLPSWMIRDAALQSSGLLNPALGGPTVTPYQPEGVWAEMFMGRFQYEPSQGPAQFRRTLYAFWRRSSAPTFLFDSAQRRVCEVQPRRTNTPLHALTLLNDQNILEASRELARVAVQQARSPRERITVIYRRALSRTPTEREHFVLAAQLDRNLEYYRGRVEDAVRLLTFGQQLREASDDPAELAAYMIVASMVYNLDEAVTRE